MSDKPLHEQFRDLRDDHWPKERTFKHVVAHASEILRALEYRDHYQKRITALEAMNGRQERTIGAQAERIAELERERDDWIKHRARREQMAREDCERIAALEDALGGMATTHLAIGQPVHWHGYAGSDSPCETPITCAETARIWRGATP